MTARAISIEAYHRHIQSGKALTQWAGIYRFLENIERTDLEAYTRAELAERLSMRVSSVCGRVRELLNAGMIEELPRRGCTVTGDMAHPLRVKERGNE